MITRRNISKLMLAGALTAAASRTLAVQGAAFEIGLRDARAIAGQSGNRLREGLMKALALYSKTSKPMKVRFAAALVVDGEPRDIFVSGPFEFVPGKMSFPGENFFPGGSFFPKEWSASGEAVQSAPFRPGEDVKGAIQRQSSRAIEAAKGKNGLFLVVLDTQGEQNTSGLSLIWNI